jgi:hypothetical protein
LFGALDGSLESLHWGGHREVEERARKSGNRDLRANDTVLSAKRRRMVEVN